MANPRVFISSTYYDLRNIREDIGNFIRELGYEPVMHDKSNVAYSQNHSLEQSCYDELSTCDIVICIIGNKYGSKSEYSNYSITMEELNKAIKSRKKIYVFISNDVYIENNTYIANINTGSFVPAFADNIKIHEYISEIKKTIRNNPIQPFNTVSDIIDTLKKQLAGLFQYLLVQEASATEAKTYYDLQQSSQNIKDLVAELSEKHNEFFRKFDSSIFATNFILKTLRNKLKMEKAIFFARDLDALDEMLQFLGFYTENELPIGPYIYEKVIGNKKTRLILGSELFETDGKLKDIRNSATVDKYLQWEEIEVEDDGELPF